MNETICAIATAAGGALGIIRISGDQSLEILSRIFTKDLTNAKPNTIHYGHITDQTSNLIDEVLVSVFRAPHSYTGEDSAEISCHGSRYILNKVLELLVQNGARMAHPGEFTQRAYLNGKLDLSQAEAVADLIASSNKATHDIALSQLRGHFSSELAQLRDQLLKLTSLLELELDFSDHEDLEFADRTELLQLAQKIDARITHLAKTFQAGNALKNGIPVAIVGAPNVGKSTLLNALVGEERAIVSDIQGTTRDAIEDTIQLGGITFRFIDTAGIRHTDDHIERLGIDRSLTAAQRATIILMMTEPGVPYPDLPIREGQTVIRIENKTEAFQAKYGIGLDELRTQLLAAAPQAADTDIIITNARHHEALLRAHDSLARVIDGLQQQLSGDLLSEDLRLTLDALADITGGQITPQETLNNIFSHFCVGK
ncbi:MAG: tRNA uridine-5-carboxymethylaminomethyl(34) synthesis GTPase MnmE [Bacteroidaceae bacterium]|nr:tRNA uridine-5-carboxymethylaminomethyl(34) synthesis GTPase MnmE [Bacteroidaceae bacterium]